MSNVLTTAVKSGHGGAVLIAGFLGLILSDIIPTPGDAIYFWDQQRLKKLLEDKKITPKQYWVKNALGYYLYNSAWWGLVFGVVMVGGGSFNHKLKLGMALSGVGIVGAVIYKNIQKDENNNQPR